jgi:hypothetical protein
MDPRGVFDRSKSALKAPRRMGALPLPAGHVRGTTMKRMQKIASEGKWWYISTQTKDKTEIPGK